MINRLTEITDDQDDKPLRKIIVWNKPVEFDAGDPEKGLVVTRTIRIVMRGELMESTES